MVAFTRMGATTRNPVGTDFPGVLLAEPRAGLLGRAAVFALSGVELVRGHPKRGRGARNV